MKVCVFCGASDKANPEFLDLAYEVGDRLGSHGHELVYGGGASGLMGKVAHGFDKHGAKIHGISMPQFHGSADRFDTFIATNIVHRKELMFEEADTFVVLPGSFGTFDEITWVMAEAQYGDHNKHIYCVTDFFKPVEEIIERMIENNLAPDTLRGRITFVDTAEQLVACIAK